MHDFPVQSLCFLHMKEDGLDKIYTLDICCLALLGEEENGGEDAC